jgi:hypothetical protein
VPPLADAPQKANCHLFSDTKAAVVPYAAMKMLIAPALAAGLLAACSTLAGPPVAPEGSAVALGHPVAVADLTITPISVVEDSRCPINARCVWAGRIVVETQVDGAGWQDVLPLTLGEPGTTRGHVLNLTSAEPGNMAGGPRVQPEDYRFTFERGAPD